ncbi:MAG: beta-propeller fold lactonase family protein [Clostridia bacterium]|nr:beta-propeller fold lactonase family protein [Clostridia bacterium]
MKLIISGYGDAGNKNIVKCDEFGNVVWADTIESPSFVEVVGNRLFAVTENDNESYMYSYVQDGEEGYRLVDSARFDGTDLCHICYSDKHNMLFGACWGSGHLIYATLDAEGKFVKTASVYQAIENGDESLTSRVHYVSVNKAQDTLMVNNVGLDIIYFYEIRNGELFEKDRIYTEKGQHPRHSVYNRDESILYVITELSNEVLVYKMPEKKLLQKISTLPSGFEGKSHCSAICLSPDGKTVYGANRYSESLVFFGVDDNGKLYEKLRLPTDGEKPRHMILTKDGKNLIVCYQVSGEVCVMPLGDNGLPIEGAAHKFSFPNAAGVAEL